VSSALQPRDETADASRIARRLGSKHVVYCVDVLSEKRISNNPVDRCYHCKKLLMKKIKELAEKKRYVAIEASNRSDLKDHRPGLKAVRCLGIKSPLIEAGLKKIDIRRAAKERGLPDWSKPSSACLASRVPYNKAITVGTLKRVENAEGYLKRLGLSQVRVRDHFPVARIETEDRAFKTLIANRHKICKYLRRLGYKHIAMDLDGYRTGSLNP
jgi:uncharacterized protein